jgi:hypothetical protein
MPQQVTNIKKRIASIKGAYKVTSAMKLISTVKLKKWRNTMLDNKLYAKELSNIIKEIFKYTEEVKNPFFEVNTKKRKYVANDLRTDQLKSLYEAEKTWANSLRSPYPVTTECNYAAVKIAKSTLNNKKDIDPAVRKYLEWIIDNYSSVEKLGIDSLYNKSTFDPASAENLDHHLRKLISDNNITVTEYDLSWMDEYDEGDELI